MTAFDKILQMYRRVFTILCVLLFLLGVATITYWRYVGDKRDRVSEQIAKRVLSYDGHPIDFAELTDFDWDRVYCFDCYSGPELIEQRIGFAWPGLGGSTIEMSEGVNLIVFVKDRRVVRSFDHPRNEGDFGHIHNSEGIAKSQARFVLPNSGGGNHLNERPWPYLALADADGIRLTTAAASQPVPFYSPSPSPLR